MVKNGWATASLLICLLSCGPKESLSHDWYDRECCSDRDCRPANPGEVIEKDGGYWIESSKEHLKYDNPKVRHTSQDNQFHLCQWQDQRQISRNYHIPGSTLTRCLYVPNVGM